MAFSQAYLGDAAEPQRRKMKGSRDLASNGFFRDCIARDFRFRVFRNHHRSALPAQTPEH
jgi:hypothetical protein